MEVAFCNQTVIKFAGCRIIGARSDRRTFPDSEIRLKTRFRCLNNFIHVKKIMYSCVLQVIFENSEFGLPFPLFHVIWERCLAFLRR